ncbi:type I-E CRISPR-associated protein Cse1/CasA, partial [Streptomyces xiamenensis]
VRAGKVAAEKAAWHLSTALRSAWRNYTTPFGDDRPGDGPRGKGAGPWPEAGLTAYWPAAEEYFWNALDAQDFTDALPAVGRIALRVYDDVTASVAHTPRGAKARDSSRGLVASLLKSTNHP